MSQLLISILGIIAGIAAALVAAFGTVWREHKKDILERYEERADIYKREHFKKLIEIIKENKENQEKFLNDNGGYGYTGFSTLQTPGISIENDEKKLTIGFRQRFINDECLKSHLVSYPYKGDSKAKNIAELISNVKKKEGEYGKSVIATLNLIMRDLDEIENKIKGVAPIESPYTSVSEVKDMGTLHVPNSNPSYVRYNKHAIIQCLIDKIDFKEEDFIIGDFGLISPESGYEILQYKNSHLDETQLGIFLKICQKISNKYSEELEKIEECRIVGDIYKDYKTIRITFENIIESFESGLSIEGTCDVCEKIDKGKVDKKLMAYK